SVSGYFAILLPGDSWSVDARRYYALSDVTVFGVADLGIVDLLVRIQRLLLRRRRSTGWITLCPPTPWLPDASLRPWRHPPHERSNDLIHEKDDCDIEKIA